MATGQDKLVELVRWAGRNMAHNIEFVPAEKLDWKPAPTSRSVLDLANHIVSSYIWSKNLVTGKKEDAEEVKTKEDAIEAVKEGTKKFADYVESLKKDELKRMITIPMMGDMSVEQIIQLAVIDAIHHRGQVCYIQTILGDTTDHYEM
jgi:uncharacterized damage-inducible protein DinB